MEATKLSDKHNPRAAYRIKTTDGEVTFVRTVLRPEILLALDSRGEYCRVHGFVRFTDEDGELRGVR